MAFEQYRGVRIALTSYSEIRYEGILSDVDPTASSIALTDVISFGTEGRRIEKDGNADAEIAPQPDKIYPYICFRAANVKDLVVIDSKQASETKKEDDVVQQDPAIITCQPAKSERSNQRNLDSSSLHGTDSFKSQSHRSRKSAEENQNRTNNRSKSPTHQEHHHHRHSSHYHHKDPPPHRGGHHHRHHRARPLGPVIPQGEFNFDESNAKLDKEALAREFSALNVNDSSMNEEGSETGGEGKSSSSNYPYVATDVYYDKNSSFFDTISCDSQDRAHRGGMDYQQRRQRMYQERRTNLETFGVSSTGPGYGRGGHRGGYRSGYNRPREEQQQ